MNVLGLNLRCLPSEMWTRSMSMTVKEMAAKNQVEKLAVMNIFRLKLTNDDYATIEYTRKGNEYDLIHTNVPDKYQGHGIGTLFAQRTFDYIAGNKWRMKLTCNFLRDYYEKNKQKYHEYVIEHKLKVKN